MHLAALRFFIASALALIGGQALAQGTFTDAAGATHPGVVLMCLDSTGKAIPSVNGGNCIGAGGGGGAGAVYGPDAVGVAPTHPPIIVGGTSDGTAAGNINPWKVGTGGIGFINCSNCSGTGISVNFGASIGAIGTPGGFKDG